MFWPAAPATQCRPSAVPMRATGHRPGTRPPNRVGGSASPATPAAVSPARRPLLAPLAAAQHQERVRQQHQRDVVLPAPPPPALEVVQAQLVLEFLVTVFHPPAALSRPHQPPQRRA